MNIAASGICSTSYTVSHARGVLKSIDPRYASKELKSRVLHVLRTPEKNDRRRFVPTSMMLVDGIPIYTVGEYVPWLGELIADHVRQGKSLYAIARLTQTPYSIVLRTYKEYVVRSALHKIYEVAS
jgi:hypothetical protein